MTDRNARIAEVTAQIAALREVRAVRDSKLAASATSRVKGYNAFFASAYFAEVAVDAEVDLTAMFDLCDKTLDRMTKMLKAVKVNGDFSLQGESDQNRYCFNMIKTAVNAHNAKVAMITRDDSTAAASKRETANEYVAINSKLVADSTAVRQMQQIAAPVLAALNVIEVEKLGSRIVGYKAKPKSEMFKRFAKMVKAEQAAQNG